MFHPMIIMLHYMVCSTYLHMQHSYVPTVYTVWLVWTLFYTSRHCDLCYISSTHLDIVSCVTHTSYIHPSLHTHIMTCVTNVLSIQTLWLTLHILWLRLPNLWLALRTLIYVTNILFMQTLWLTLHTLWVALHLFHPYIHCDL